jgi:hypothetical protein
MFACEKKEKMSQYKGVYLIKTSGKWCARMRLNAGGHRYGGIFNEDVDAAKRVNQLCEELQIPLKNPGLTGGPNEKWQVTQNIFNKITFAVK